MSSKKFATPLRIEPQASAQLRVFLIAVHGGALMALLATGLFWPVKLAAVTALFTSLSYFLGSYSPRNARSIMALVWGEQGEWVLQRMNGLTECAWLRRGSFCHPRLVVLNFRLERFPYWTSVVLPPDSLSATVHRRLRVRLKLAGVVEPEDRSVP